MNELKVSIQIPTYNQERYIQRAILSALAQDYDNLEVVVLDDASPDNTFGVASELEDVRLTILKNTTNLGRVGTYHKLLHKCVQGDWVVNLDGDDYYKDTEFISRAVQQLNKHPKAVLYQAQQRNLSRIIKFCKGEKIDDQSVICNGLDFLMNYKNIRKFSHLASLYPRGLAIELGFYTDDCLITDFVSVMKLSTKGQFISSNCQVGYWDFNDRSDSNNMGLPLEQLKNEKGLKGLVSSLRLGNAKQQRRLLGDLTILHSHYGNISQLQKKTRGKGLTFALGRFDFSLYSFHLLYKALISFLK